ncbi:MAG: hypothetical protein ACLTOJ_04860 [[Clostridium] symbiosum]
MSGKEFEWNGIHRRGANVLLERNRICNLFGEGISTIADAVVYYFELLAPLYNAMVWRPPVK